MGDSFQRALFTPGCFSSRGTNSVSVACAILCSLQPGTGPPGSCLTPLHTAVAASCT